MAGRDEHNEEAGWRLACCGLEALFYVIVVLAALLALPVWSAIKWAAAAALAVLAGWYCWRRVATRRRKP